MSIRSRRTDATTFLITLVATLVVGLVPAAALAQDGYAEQSASNKDDFSRPGGYLSLGVGGANAMFTGGFDPFNDLLSQALIIGIRGGQRINRYLAFDASLDYSVIGFEAEYVSNGVTSEEVKSVTGFGNLKLYPIGGRIQPYAMGGVGFVWGAFNAYDTNGSLTGTLEEIVFAGRAGGGLDVYLTRTIALSGEVAYVIPTGDLSDLNYLQYTGHILFRF